MPRGAAMPAAFAAFILASACAAVDPLDSLVRTEMETRRIPGLSYAIVKDGAVIDMRAYGVSNMELATPAAADTVYAIGSITKSMTAIATMRLVEDGRLDLDASVTAYAPASPEHWRPVTLRHLLANASGIPDNVDNPCKQPASETYTTEDTAAEVACLPLLFEPGHRFSYSNSNFVVLSVIIEHVTGRPLGDVFSDTIFKPLGMGDTRMADYRALIARRADGYVWTGVGHENVPEMDPAVESGAGGVLSTAGDMAKFILGLGDERLLNEAGWTTLWTRFPVAEGETPYGLGFGVTPFEGRRRIGHNGSAPGFASSFAWFPDQGVGIILLANGYEEPHGRSAMGLANAIAAKYFD